MKKINEHIEKWSSAIDQRWKSMARKQQRKYLISFTTLYLIITIVVMAFAWNEGRKNHSENPNVIRNIGNPLLNQKNPLKYSEYGRAK